MARTSSVHPIYTRYLWPLTLYLRLKRELVAARGPRSQARLRRRIMNLERAMPLILLRVYRADPEKFHVG
jgi:hypothetical protein